MRDAAVRGRGHCGAAAAVILQMDLLDAVVELHGGAAGMMFVSLIATHVPVRPIAAPLPKLLNCLKEPAA